MLHLVLADAELERVPPRIAGHPQVVEAARRLATSPRTMMLDSSLHHAAMRGLPDAERRGRPDLVHVFLLTALESIANKEGQLRVSVHTRHDELLTVEPETRLVRNYGRFCGLLHQLFERGQVGEPKPLLRLEPNLTLEKVLQRQAAETTLVLDPAGEARAPSRVFDGVRPGGDVTAIIGGFPSGDYRSPMPPGARRISIHPAPLTVWTVAAELLAHYPRKGAALQR